MQVKFYMTCAINFLLFGVNAWSRFKYSVHDWRTCDSDNKEFLTVKNIPIQNCLLECRVRVRCNVVRFLTIRRECMLLETDISMVIRHHMMDNRVQFSYPERSRNWPSSNEYRPCIYIRMTDVVDVSKIPSVCQNCSAKQVCDVPTESCNQETICEHNWIKIKHSCYFIRLTKNRFAEAQEYCTSNDAHLVHLETAVENKAIDKYLENRWGYVYGWWIGITNEETEGEWRFTQCNSVVKYFNWGRCQPNGINSNITEKCVMIFKRDRLWHDFSCNKPAQSICEKW